MIQLTQIILLIQVAQVGDKVELILLGGGIKSLYQNIINILKMN